MSGVRADVGERRPGPQWVRIVAVTGGGCVVICALACAGLAVLIAAGGASPLVRAALQAKLGRPVAFARLAVSPAGEGVRVVFTDLVLGQPASFGPGVLLRTPRAEFVLRLLPLLAGRIEAPVALVASPELHLRRRGPGDDNWTLGKGGGAAGVLAATRMLRITDGRLQLDDPPRQVALTGTFASDPASADLPLRLEVSGLLRGEPLRVSARGGALNGRRPHQPHAVRLVMVDGATTVTMAGTSQAPFDFRGLDMDVTARGPNLADLIYLFAFTTPNSPPYRLSGHMHRLDRSFALTHLDAHIGDSDLEGDLHSQHADRRRIDAVLHSRRLTASDLRVLLASPPGHAQARDRPGVAGKARPQGGRLFSATPVSLERLQGSDETVAYHVDAADGFGVPITGADLRLTIAQGRLSLSPLSLHTAGGDVRIAYVLNTRSPTPQVRLAARVRGVRLAQLGRAGFTGRLDADVDVSGAGASLARQAATAHGRASLHASAGTVPRLDAAALSGDVLGVLGAALDRKSKAPLRCVAADFAVAAGVARATRLVVATSEGTATGGGEVDLGREELHLQLEASSRGPKPLVQLRAPIVLEGPLAHPRVVVRPTPAEGLKALFSPLARLVGRGTPPGPPAPAC